MIKQLLLASLVIFLAHPILSMNSNGEGWEESTRDKEVQDALNVRLYDAVENDLLDEAQDFLNRGAQVNAHSEFFGWTPLMEAISARSKPMCLLLLEFGADISIQCKTGHNPLDLAAARTMKPFCKLLITQATFGCPRPSMAQQRNSHDLIFTFLLGLNRVCPKLPKEIRYMILSATAHVRQHVMNTACGVHRFHPERMPFLPIRVVQALIKGDIISQEAAINAIANHNSSIIIPLLDDARRGAQQQKIHELLDPEKFEEHFGEDIKKHIAKRLGSK